MWNTHRSARTADGDTSRMPAPAASTPAAVASGRIADRRRIAHTRTYTRAASNRDAASASESSTRPRRRRPSKALVFRRGMFRDLEHRPPWTLTLSADVHELGMEEHDGLNPERGGKRGARGGDTGASSSSSSMDGASIDDDDFGNDLGVTVKAEVAPVGQGFFITGKVRMRCVVECECCGVAHLGEPIEAPVKVWLDDATDATDDSSGEWDIVPFGRNTEECDLAGAVRDYVRMAAPYEILCGACGDGDGAGDEPFSFRLEPED